MTQRHMDDQEWDIDNISVLVRTDSDPTDYPEDRAVLPPPRPKRDERPRRGYVPTACEYVFIGLYYVCVAIDAVFGLMTECLVCACLDEV